MKSKTLTLILAIIAWKITRGAIQGGFQENSPSTSDMSAENSEITSEQTSAPAQSGMLLNIISITSL